MSKLRVSSFSVSLDGYGAALNQDVNNPFGVGGLVLPKWFFKTQTFQKMHGSGSGEPGIDEDFAAAGFKNIGAWILGRNMFGPVRGSWPDDSWKGWWGEEPPYHTQVFVLTHHARPSLAMKGGTTFHFVTDGIHAAWERAREAANGQDVRVGGGVSTVRQYLQAKLIDDLHLAFTPVLLGAGENLFAGLNLPELGYQAVQSVKSEHATHVTIKKQ